MLVRGIPVAGHLLPSAAERMARSGSAGVMLYRWHDAALGQRSLSEVVAEVIK